MSVASSRIASKRENGGICNNTYEPADREIFSPTEDLETSSLDKLIKLSIKNNKMLKFLKDDVEVIKKTLNSLATNSEIIPSITTTNLNLIKKKFPLNSTDDLQEMDKILKNNEELLETIVCD